MDYESLADVPDTESLFRTARGSTYAHTSNGTTVRNRSGANHSDTTTGIQPASTKTLYMDPRATNAVGAWIQDPTTATRLVPEMKDGKFTGHALVQMAEDHVIPQSKWNPEGKVYKAGEIVSRVPVSLKPEVGLHPVEIYGSSESPKGSKARNIHFGNQITEVFPKGAAGVNRFGDVPKVDVLPNPLMDPIRKMQDQLKGYSRHAKGGMIDTPLPGGHKII